MRHMHRVALAFLVLAGAHGRAQRRGNLAARKARGRMAAGVQRDREAAKLLWLAEPGHPALRLGQARAAPHVGGGLGTQQQRPRAAGDLGGVHRVVVVRMHRDHRCQFAHPARNTHALQPLGDGLHVRLHLAQKSLQLVGAREEPVRHQRCLAIVQQHGGHAEKSHLEARCRLTTAGSLPPQIGLGLQRRMLLQGPDQRAQSQKHQQCQRPQRSLHPHGEPHHAARASTTPLRRSTSVPNSVAIRYMLTE